MKVAVIGASGFLGSNILRTLQLAGIDAIGTSFSHHIEGLISLDATDFRSMSGFLDDQSPDVVVLAAGTKDINKCEQDWATAERVNVDPARNLVKYLTLNCSTIYPILISTDYVFDGRHGNYRNTDRTDPVTNYGRSKLMAEKALQEADIPFKIVRTAAVMGRGSRFFDWLMQELKKGSRIEAYDNIRFSPTPLGLFNECMLNLIEDISSVNEEVIHMVGPESMSRYHLAIMMRDITGLEADIVPQKADGLFQADLSLIPSESMTAWTKKSLLRYLQDEL